jgi:hypothetical protein
MEYSPKASASRMHNRQDYDAILSWFRLITAQHKDREGNRKSKEITGGRKSSSATMC